MGQIRVFRTQGYKGLIIDYNPPIPPTNEQIILHFGNTMVANLCFDPFEWMWKKVRKLDPLNIFEYTTK
jgi:hypothetical protein